MPTISRVHSTISALEVGRGQGTLPVTFSYAASDPFAVTVTIIQNADRPSGGLQIKSWIFARDILRQGLEGQAGKGWVTVSPIAGAIELHLRDQQTTRLQLDRDSLTEFLNSTYEAVPTRRESNLISWDKWLADILVS